MQTILRLGKIDEGVALTDTEKRRFMDLYHHPAGFSPTELRFRDDCRNTWWEWESVPGRPVQDLTHTLQAAGFMPHAVHDGIFGYVTQAAVRLFQEYMRTEEWASGGGVNDRPPSWPDGVVGPHTRHHLSAWRDAGKRCRWSEPPTGGEYAGWMDWLRGVKQYYTERPTLTMQQLAGAERRGDSLPPAEWQYGDEDPHLIGLRRNADDLPSAGARRPPDDLFILLLNGRVFHFWGSTDPNPGEGAEAYLAEGQHRYRFNWHNIGSKRRERIYKAARPAGAGVLVVRDVHQDNALTERNRRDGFDPRPNPTINLHWSGLGRSNWSAGCQVISGGSYRNDLGKTIDCRAFTARNDRERGTKRDPGGPRLTMGAYTFLSDLLLCYTPQERAAEKPVFRYTLLEESVLDHVPGPDKAQLRASLNDLRGLANQ